MINTSTLPGEKAEIGPGIGIGTFVVFFNCTHVGNVIACPDSPVLHSSNTFLPQWITR